MHNGGVIVGAVLAIVAVIMILNTTKKSRSSFERGLKPVIPPDKIRPGYPHYSLYGWRTNPPPNYPQKMVNTKFDIAMTDCCKQCNNNLLRGFDFDYRSKANCLKQCQIRASKAQGTLMGPPKTTLTEGYGWVPSTRLSNGVFCFRQGGCTDNDQSCPFL